MTSSRSRISASNASGVLLLDTYVGVHTCEQRMRREKQKDKKPIRKEIQIQ